MIRFGPDPVLHFPRKGGDVGKAHRNGFCILFAPFGGRFFFHGHVFVLVGRIVYHPNLQGLSGLFFGDVFQDLRVLIVVSEPVGIVDCQNGAVVSTFMGITLMKYHRNWFVGGSVN